MADLLCRPPFQRQLQKSQWLCTDAVSSRNQIMILLCLESASGFLLEPQKLTPVAPYCRAPLGLSHLVLKPSLGIGASWTPEVTSSTWALVHRDWNCSRIDLCFTVLGAGKSKIRVAPDLFAWWRLFCLQDGAFSCVFQKRRMHHHLQKMEGQESLFLKGFSPIYYESILYGSITSPVLKGAHCSHALWLAYISSPLTWLLPSHGPDYISNVISEKPGLASLLEQHLLSHDDMSSMAMPTFSAVWDATIWVWSCTQLGSPRSFSSVWYRISQPFTHPANTALSSLRATHCPGTQSPCSKSVLYFGEGRLRVFKNLLANE